MSENVGGTGNVDPALPKHVFCGDHQQTQGNSGIVGRGEAHQTAGDKVCGVDGVHRHASGGRRHDDAAQDEKYRYAQVTGIEDCRFHPARNGGKQGGNVVAFGQVKEHHPEGCEAP
ncbi:hypothetical protein D3C77_418210 [compost metagenome]